MIGPYITYKFLVFVRCYTYNAVVKNSKFIHVLLIALVFCSQLAASVHVVNHLHPGSRSLNASTIAGLHDSDHTHNHSHTFSQHDKSHACDLKSLSFASSNATYAERCKNSSYQADTAENTQGPYHEKLDCIGFHLLLNLGAAFVGQQNDVCLQLPRAEKSLAFASFRVVKTAEYHPIRAPPLSS